MHSEKQKCIYFAEMTQSPNPFYIFKNWYQNEDFILNLLEYHREIMGNNSKNINSKKMQEPKYLKQNPKLRFQ